MSTLPIFNVKVEERRIVCAFDHDFLDEGVDVHFFWKNAKLLEKAVERDVSFFRISNGVNVFAFRAIELR